MSLVVARKDSLKVCANLGVTNNDRAPVVIQDLAKNPAWVASAVDQLKEIDFHLQNKEIDQHKKVTDNINNVINCLQTLDIYRLQLHEELEKEAITTFGLLHTIKTLPLSIKVEIDEAVKAAHAQNEIDIKDKTAFVSELENKIRTIRDEQQRLEKDNNALLPKRNLIRKQHDGLIINLNKLLEEKSMIQITVNETRENIRKHNQEILETELEIQNLKAAFNKEKDQTNQKIQDCKSNIQKVKKKKESWDQKNMHVSKQLSAVNADLAERKLALQDLQNKEKIEEKALLDVKKENQNLKLQIDAETNAQANLANTEKKLNEKLTKLKKKYGNILNEKETILNDLKLRVENETKRSEELQTCEEELQKAIVECTEAELEAKKEVEEAEDKLEKKRIEFSEHAENLASLDSENTRNKDATQKMSETHNLVMAQLNREIEKQKTALKEEKQLRFEAQKERDSLIQQSRVTEEEKIKYALEMNQKISEMKEQVAEKSIKGKELQKDVQELNQALQKLEEEFKTKEEELKKLADEKEEMVKQTKNTIATLEEEIKEYTKIIEEKTPFYEEVEKDYKEKCKIYQERKEAFSTHRHNETELKKEFHQKQKDLEEMKTTQEKQQQEIKVSQDEYLSMLNSNSEESKLLEEEIYVQSCKLKSIIGENYTLKKGGEELEKEIVETDQCIEDGKKLQQQIIEELIETRQKLANSFTETTTMEEMLLCRDTELMHQMSGALNVLNHNSQQVDSVAEQLFKQLEGLGIYLEKVSDKRAL